MSAQSFLFNPSERTLATTGDGFSLPTMTTTQRTGMSLTASQLGMSVYDTTLNQQFTWTGAAWIASGARASTWVPTLIDSGGGRTFTFTVADARFVSIGGAIIFNASFNVSAASGVASGNLQVLLPVPAIVANFQPLAVVASGLAAGATTALVGSATGTSANLFHYAAGVNNSLAPHVQASSVVSVGGTYIQA